MIGLRKCSDKCQVKNNVILPKHLKYLIAELLITLWQVVFKMPNLALNKQNGNRTQKKCILLRPTKKREKRIQTELRPQPMPPIAVNTKKAVF